jgi:hypothetical protein
MLFEPAMTATNPIPPQLLVQRPGPSVTRHIRTPRGPLRYGLLVFAALASVFAVVVVQRPDGARPAPVAPPPVAIALPTAAGAEGAPPAAASVDAGVGSAPARPVPRVAAPPRAYLSPNVSIGARRALNSVATAIVLAPRVFPGFESHCTHITSLLASVQGQVMAGNFRDADGACYVWINLTTTAGISGADLCKLSLHELGHLGGYSHVADAADVMHSPFVPKPTPPACEEQPGALRAARAAGR